LQEGNQNKRKAQAMNKTVISTILILLNGLTVCNGTANAEPVTYSWTGTIKTIRLDDGTGTYAGTQIGDTFSGTFTYDPDAGNATIGETSDWNSTIDPGDTWAGYFPGIGGATITDGTTQVNVPLERYRTCTGPQGPDIDPASCVGVRTMNDHTMDPDDERTESEVFSDVLGKDVPWGTVVDEWSLNAQAETFEFGVSYLSLLTNIHDDLSFRANPPWSPPGSPPGPDNQVAWFHMWEYDIPRDESLFSAYGFITMAQIQQSNALPDLVSLGDVNGNNRTDLGVLLRDSVTDRNKL
jgi:hypothetical protein